MIRNLLVYLTHPHVDAWNFKSRHKEQICRHLPNINVTVCYHSREFVDRLPEADAVLVWFFKREWLERGSRLKLIATPAAGTDWIDLPPGDGPRVWFGGFHGPLMAESVLGAMLYFTKAFPLSLAMQRKKKWARVKISENIRSLAGARVTILGFGRIGKSIARILKPFGCGITGIKRVMEPPPEYFDKEDRVVTVDRLPEVLGKTEHLIVVLPGGAETEGLLTPDLLAALPPRAFFYNVGRGNVVREDTLVEALRRGRPAGAYLDVFETEPLPQTSPLWELDNVLIQPHLSAASPQYLDLCVEELVERLKNWKAVS